MAFVIVFSRKYELYVVFLSGIIGYNNYTMKENKKILKESGDK